MSDDKFKSEHYQLLAGINAKTSDYLNGPLNMRDIVNMNFVNTGALTKRPGTGLYAGATVIGKITGGVDFQRLNGASYVVVSANTNVYTLTSSFNVFKSGVLNNAIFDFVVFVDRLFGGNGQDFFKFDGTNVQPFSLPFGDSGFGAGGSVGGSLTSGVTGIFTLAYGYVNDRGYYGPASQGITVVIDGSTKNSASYSGLTYMANYGISYIALYRTSNGGVDLAGTTLIPIANVVAGATFTDTGFPLTDLLASDALFFTLAPKYLEIYNNQLFMGGFSGFLSTVFWSDIGEPESIQPDFNAEFRTNDGDKVTGLKTYNGSLIVSKNLSFHRVTGDDPSNFLLQEISDQYGCLSNRTLIVYEDTIWFLDSKGIVEYNGANIKIISNEVEPTFKSMNVDAAIDNACGLHVRDANEIWFAIPINGSTVNNCIVVYDYLVKSWTTYKGLAVSHFMLARGSLGKISPFFGSYSGSISYFSASMMSDNGSAVTCMFKPPFLAAQGQTNEQQYRRFYLDVNPVLGVTQPITINLRSDYGSTIQVTRTMYQSPFQSRIDFGIPARSIQPEVIHASATLGFVVNGYAFVYRPQRDV